MSLRLVVRREAFGDLQSAIEWYESQRPGLGHDFKRVVRSRIRQILERPLAFPIVLESVRCAMVPRFPYGVYFAVKGSRIVVLSIPHFKQSPRHWKDRR